jgi:hypothetical protein
MRYLIILAAIFFTILPIFQCRCQEKINVSLGVGMTEWGNIGLRYQMKQTQLVLNYGTNFIFKDQDGNPSNLMVISGSVYKHLFGESKFSTRMPWFLKAGVSYARKTNNHLLRSREGFVNLIFGRDINFSKRLGSDIGVGVFTRVYQYRIDAIDSNGQPFIVGENDVFQIYPALDINLFYRFLGKKG